MATEQDSEGENLGAPRRVSDTELIESIKSNTTEKPVATTGEVAELVSIQTQSVYHRLKTLHEKGVIENIDSGNSLLWYVEEDH